MGDRRINLKNRFAVILLFLSGSLFAASSTYTFTAGAGTDKWAYDAVDTATPPTSGPDLTGQIEITDYTNIDSANNVYHSSAIYSTNMPFLNCKFTIGEATSSISQIYVEWEGYNTAFNSTSTQIRIWDFNLSAWTFLDGYDGEAEVALSSAITSNFGNYISGGELYAHAVGRGAWDFVNPSVLYSDFIKVVITYTGDTTPPAGISSLSALAGISAGTVRLKWICPGDDGTGGGNVTSYEVKYATFCIDSEIDYAYAATYSPASSWIAGTFGTEHEIKTVSDLTNGVTYWFAIKATDDNTNQGIWPGSYAFAAYTGGTIDDINCYYAAGGADTTPPAGISNLTALTGDSAGTVKLKWTAPGDDGTGGGNVNGYLVKYATNIIGSGGWNFFDARVSTYIDAAGWTPVTFGQEETGRVVSGLTPGTTYYFAIKSFDETSNEGIWPNISVYQSGTNSINCAWAQSGGGGVGEGIECTEIMYDTPAGSNDSGGEWLEFYNNTGGMVNLAGWYLKVGVNPELLSQRTGWGDITAIPDKTFFVISEPAAIVDFDTIYGQDVGKYCAVTGSALTLLDTGGDQIVLVTALTGGTTYQNFVCSDNAVDTSIEKTNFSDNENLSESWIASLISTGTPFAAGQTTVPSDSTPPAAISNLTALTGDSAGTVKLKWTAPGDDGTGGGNVQGYIVKYATFQITSSNFYNTYVSTYLDAAGWTPGTFGQEETGRVVSGLTPGTTYYFAIKAFDEASNEGIWPDISEYQSGTASINCASAQVAQGGIWKSIQGGNWDVGATWDKGTVPNYLSVVEISHTVTFNMFDAGCSSVTVYDFGTLQFDGAVSTRTLTAAGNLEIMNGGQFLMPPNTGYISTLKINCESAGQYGIIVNNGGKFDVQGNNDTTPSTRNCLIASENPSYKTYIQNLSQTEANFNMYYVEVSSVGVNDSGKYGITFDGSGTRGKINYCSIHNGNYGICLINSSNNTISDNNCYSNTDYGIYLFGGTNNTISNNNCYSNSTDGIMLDSSSNNNTLSNNNIYSNQYYGILLYNSSNNTLSNNNCYSNPSIGIYLFGGTNNTLSSNSCYSNTQYGIYTNNSINNTAVNCKFGSGGSNSNGDIGYESGYVSKLILRDCSLYSTTKVDVSGIDTAGSYLVSYNQDNSTGIAKIWGDYNISDTQKFNYADLLYVATTTAVNSTMISGEPVMTGLSISTASLVMTEFWEVKCIGGNTFSVKHGTGTVLSDAAPATYMAGPGDYLNTDRGITFNIGGSAYDEGDTFYFVTVSSSGDAGVQKIIEFSNSTVGTRLNVDAGGTITMEGTPAEPTISTASVSGEYYGFASSGTMDASNYKFFNLNSEGLKLQGTAVDVVDLSSGTFDNIQDSAGDSSYIRASGLTSAATFYNCAFNDAPGTADYNVKADGAGINWTFQNYSGVKSGVTYSSATNGAVIYWPAADTTPPTVEIMKPTTGYINGLSQIDGTANDNIAVSTVSVKVWNRQTNQYWKHTSPAWLGSEEWNAVDNLWTSSWTYTSVPSWVDGSSYTVIAKSQDTAGNWSTVYSTVTFTMDTSSPTSAVTFPVESGQYVDTDISSISGISTDTVSGISTVTISIYCQDGDKNGQYWKGDGIGWQPGEMWLNCVANDGNFDENSENWEHVVLFPTNTWVSTGT
ncbi:MAG: right-handed parallel beta-helix repeat-containing protein, partial [bacterium]